LTGKTHQALGITTGMGWFLIYSNPSYAPATFASVAVGAHLTALLPDIDQPAGALWQKLPFGKMLGKLSDPFLAHRNITHSLLGFGLIGLGLYELIKLFPSYWGIDTHILSLACMVSYASHLVADMLTEEGIPLFFPFGYMFGIPPKPFQDIRIKSGKWFENLIIFPAVNIALIALVISHWREITRVFFKS